MWTTAKTEILTTSTSQRVMELEKQREAQRVGVSVSSSTPICVQNHPKRDKPAAPSGFGKASRYYQCRLLVCLPPPAPLCRPLPAHSRSENPGTKTVRVTACTASEHFYLKGNLVDTI